MRSTAASVRLDGDTGCVSADTFGAVSSRSGVCRGWRCHQGRTVDLDEDALSRTHLGGLHDRPTVAIGHPRQTAGAARVVEGAAVFGHIGDAVLELHEDVGTVIETETVACAQVLIDPHTHGRVTIPFADST
jgi:hypothetical protein